MRCRGGVGFDFSSLSRYVDQSFRQLPRREAGEGSRTGSLMEDNNQAGRKNSPARNSASTGRLIVLEGIDGSGKSTQAGRLVERLGERGLEAILLREPSDGPWGRKIREKAASRDSLTPEEELELFVKDRRENVERKIRPALDRGRIVVLDRYYFSTMAYQGAKGIDPVEIRRINEAFAVIPDLVIVLDIPADDGLERIAGRGRRDWLFEREDYLCRVREIFLTLDDSYVRHVDASLPEDSVAAEIEALVLREIGIE